MHIHTCACVSHTQCTSSYEYIHICIYIRVYFVMFHTCTCVSHTKCTSSYEYIHICIYIRVYFVMLHTCTCVSHTNCTSFVRRHWPRCSCATRPISGRNGVPATHTENRSMCARTLRILRHAPARMPREQTHGNHPQRSTSAANAIAPWRASSAGANHRQARARVCYGACVRLAADIMAALLYPRP